MAALIQQARERHLVELARSFREGGGTCPREADLFLNRSARDVVLAYVEHGEAWLGSINAKCPRLRETVAGEPVYNFSADFVLPERDLIVEQLIAERRSAEWTGTTADAERVGEILDRIRAVGGSLLHWS